MECFPPKATKCLESKGSLLYLFVSDSKQRFSGLEGKVYYSGRQAFLRIKESFQATKSFALSQSLSSHSSKGVIPQSRKSVVPLALSKDLVALGGKDYLSHFAPITKFLHRVKSLSV